MPGEMAIIYSLTDADGGTDVLVVSDGLPQGVSTADNEVGTRMALVRLAALVEAGLSTRDPAPNLGLHMQGTVV